MLFCPTFTEMYFKLQCVYVVCHVVYQQEFTCSNYQGVAKDVRDIINDMYNDPTQFERYLLLEAAWDQRL